MPLGAHFSSRPKDARPPTFHPPGTTPQVLIDGGLYQAIATALYAEPHRAIGFALAAMNHLGAKNAKKTRSKLRSDGQQQAAAIKLQAHVRGRAVRRTASGSVYMV